MCLHRLMKDVLDWVFSLIEFSLVFNSRKTTLVISTHETVTSHPGFREISWSNRQSLEIIFVSFLFYFFEREMGVDSFVIMTTHISGWININSCTLDCRWTLILTLLMTLSLMASQTVEAPIMLLPTPQFFLKQSDEMVSGAATL